MASVISQLAHVTSPRTFEPGCNVLSQFQKSLGWSSDPSEKLCTPINWQTVEFWPLASLPARPSTHCNVRPRPLNYHNRQPNIVKFCIKNCAVVTWRQIRTSSKETTIFICLVCSGVNAHRSHVWRTAATCRAGWRGKLLFSLLLVVR